MMKLQYIGLLMRRTNSLEKTLMLGKIEGKRRRGQKRIRWSDSITNSRDLSLTKLQKMNRQTGKPGMLHSTVSQRFRGEGVTKQQ